MATKAAIINDPHHPIEHIGYSKDLKELIDRLLFKDPLKRLSIFELI
jgi:serine/threonine protein kinase